jgi:archaetidylinositol phosphate synthase
MSLGKLVRGRLERAIAPLVDALASLGVTPNQLTLYGLALTGLAMISYNLGSLGLLLAGILLAVGGFLDVLDGVMARRHGMSTPAGAFIDSFADRLSDTMIALGFLFSGLVSPLVVMLMLSSSMLVSYARARGEGLQVRVAGVGVGERGVRLLIIIAATFTAYFQPIALSISALTITIVSAITVVERTWHILKSLSSSQSLGT